MEWLQFWIVIKMFHFQQLTPSVLFLFVFFLHLHHLSLALASCDVTDFNFSQRIGVTYEIWDRTVTNGVTYEIWDRAVTNGVTY